MPRRTLALSAVGLVLMLAVPRPGAACSLCNASFQQAPSMRQEAALPTARVVVIGTAHNPRLNGDGTGTTELHLTHVLRNDPFLADKKVIDVPRYLAVSDPKNPPRFLVFCDVFKDRLDPFRGVPLKTADSVEYVRQAVALDPKDTPTNLLFFFRYLEHADPEVARDAFLEFAKATDRDIGQVGRRLDPDRLRGWLKDTRTPAERLSVYALLLGACGRDEDAAFLRGLLDEQGDRVANAYDGLLGGYMHLRPREGWDLALAALRDGRKPLPVRLAVVRTLRFWHGWQPRESRANVLRCQAAILEQGDLADLAVEDLRRWQVWDLTREVLGLYGKKGYDAPIVQQAILRYALTCDDAACRAFLDDRRRKEPEAVRDVEEQLKAEKQ
jgi:hypothetical protein